MKKSSLLIALIMFLGCFQVAWADNAEEPSTPQKQSNESVTVEDIKEQSNLPADFYRAGKGEDEEEEIEEEVKEETKENQIVVTKKVSEPNVPVSAKNKVFQRFIASKNRNVSVTQREAIANAVEVSANKYNVRTTLIMAVIWKESTFSPTTHTGPCYGLMQVHKSYSGLSEKEMYQIGTNVNKGTQELASNLKKYGGNEVMALTAYNCGTGNVARGNYTTKYANNVLAKEQKIIAFMQQQQ